ncbi:D-arabinono-1,4-lactone oxidase [Zestomonas carbonaria]|uniref:L-gulono-1,4-lactone dehydrogenase n=1 Tax=Zestomonas carbonaria TaxID=2762745 RepID=A0A7U7EM18_9GAMM|nr:D-arabinono-1,4-lactone oxidase [Pseudomonas carbonaria]CAD5107462.1 L-gulono-1,4-lactone dehydrogenase [Pseudomonas carbonaria]
MNQRREFLRNTLSLAVGAAAVSSLPGCVFESDQEPQSPVAVEPGKPLPWINWAGNQHCYPSHRVSPANEDELVAAVKQAKGVIRPVGSGHSFSPVVPTDDTLLSTDLLSGVVAHDPEKLQAEVLSGTRIHNLGPMLHALGQAMPNLLDMDYPSLGGAIANACHGTGSNFGCMSDYVVGLKLVTPAGELLECSAEKNSEIFHAAKTSVGALGVIASMVIQNQAPFELTEVNRIERTEDVLDDLDNRFARHRHFEFLPLPHTELCITMTTDLAKPGDVDQGEDDPMAVNQIKDAFDATSWVPFFGSRIYEGLINGQLQDSLGEVVRSGPSYRVLPHVRIVRFREMEYTVPVEVGPKCLREILALVKSKNLPMPFPIEYRHVKADDIWLSMYQGQAGAAISIHQFGDRDYKALFAEIEPIFWKYHGRPHWGKLHTLNAKGLAPLYPKHWQDFQEVRRSLDPSGKMLNEHIRNIFVA